LLRGQTRGCERNNDVRLESDALGGEGGKPSEAAISREELDDEIASLCVAEVAQALEEGAIMRGRRCISEVTEPWNRWQLLRVARARRENEAESENDREPDQPHEHLVEDGWPGV
jgi:hypothetical protein